MPAQKKTGTQNLCLFVSTICDRPNHENVPFNTDGELKGYCPRCIAWAEKKLKKTKHHLDEIGPVETSNIMLEIRLAHVPLALRMKIIKALTGKSPTTELIYRPPKRYDEFGHPLKPLKGEDYGSLVDEAVYQALVRRNRKAVENAERKGRIKLKI
ncbi:MAG: hypothetical protein NTW06_03655 [Candidatus Falkowbacteria bacterium]|nr:hypothetical protein [Candidatus Falkowbacteria bacterium]